MKHLKKSLFLLIGILSFSSCQSALSSDNVTPYKEALLAEPNNPPRLEDNKRQDANYQKFISKANKFSSHLSSAFLKNSDNTNFAFSPLSIFLSLTLATEVSASSTREEILNALDLSYEEVKTYTSYLIEDLSFEDEMMEKLVSCLKLSNSIWLNADLDYNKETIDNLARDYYCYSFQEDFKNDNENVNKRIKTFIEEQTKGLIKWDYKYDVNTLFTLINTLYLKDVWNQNTDELQIRENQVFKDINGKNIDCNFLLSNYSSGRLHVEEEYSHFYAKTSAGFKFDFILPKENQNIKEILTPETIETALSFDDYFKQDDINKKRYYTRCVFPAFEASSSIDLIPTMKNEFKINSLFNDNCDLSSLTSSDAMISNFIHKAKLKVDEKGVEGAAVTMMDVAGTAGPGEYENIYEELVLERNFGFVLSYKNNIIFSGLINTL